MAISFHHIYGRKLGVDPSGYIRGEKGIKVPAVYFGTEGSEVAQFGSTAVQSVLTSGTTGTQITAAGVTVLSASSALTWTLAPPVPSARKTIVVQSTAASGTLTVRLSTALGGNFLSTLGSSFQAIPLLSAGCHVNLVGVSTAYWMVVSNTASAAMTT